MPGKRQTLLDEDSIEVRSLGLGLPDGYRIETHAHPWHQLVYGTHGVMTVDTPLGAWVVPPLRAVWIPGASEHSIRMTGQVQLRTLYLKPGVLEPSQHLPETCCVMNVSALLRELILEIMRLGMLHGKLPEQVRLRALLTDQISQSPEAALTIRVPADPRALRVALAVQAKLDSNATISSLARGSGASARTIERLFVEQTGMSFGRWRQRAKVLGALERLAAGDSVTECGLALGYDSTSAFISMFKRALGSTPGAYFSRSRT